MWYNFLGIWQGLLYVLISAGKKFSPCQVHKDGQASPMVCDTMVHLSDRRLS